MLTMLFIMIYFLLIIYAIFVEYAIQTKMCWQCDACKIHHAIIINNSTLHKSHWMQNK